MATHAGKSEVIKRNNVQVLGKPDQGLPVLLFAHGFGCNQHMWDAVTPAFVDSHQQVLFDYVGSGSSDLAAFDADKYAHPSGYVQDVLDVCDALDLHQGVVFIGHSVSCNFGLLASIARPALFDKLVLLGPNPCFVNHPPAYVGGFETADLEGLLTLMEQNYIGWANALAPMVTGQDAEGREAKTLSNSFCSTDPQAMKVFARTTFFADHRADLPEVSRPCLILQHRQDSLAPLSVGEYLHAQLSGSTLKVLDVKGHCAHMSAPGLVIDALKDLLHGTPAVNAA